MKKLIVSIAVGAFLAFAGSANALSLTDVVQGDDLVDWGTLGSGLGTEKDWVADYLGVNPESITYTQLTNSGGAFWEEVTGDGAEDLWAYDFGSFQPVLFIVKMGAGVGLVGETGTFDHFLYSNVDSVQYGVINLNEFTREQGTVEIGMVSHVGTSGEVPVPEPATMGLLGLGLVGLYVAKRRRN